MFSRPKRIRVNVANGSRSHIWCRVADERALIADAAEDVHHMTEARRGCSQIQEGNTLQFQSRTSSNSVYMTVISESCGIICTNHEITEDANYIITKRNALVEGKKRNMWIDTNGRDHMVAYDDA